MHDEATMTAAVLSAFGGPEVLVVRHDVPVPVPGREQVRVRVSAAALDNTDVRTREGAYGTAEDPDAPAGWLGPIAFPCIQGGDVAGVVDASGSDVAPDLVGRRVLVDSARVHDVTESPLTDQQLACLPIASGTAMGSSCAARGALRAREHFPSL